MIKKGDFLYKKIIYSLVIIGILAIGAIFLYTRNNAKETLSKYGSSGKEVTEIQTRLKRWGYYNGAIDGVYGTQTVNAVKYFQRNNGLTADGKCGNLTLQVLFGY